MKKIVGLVVIMSSLLLVGCGKGPSTQTITSTTSTDDWQNKDFGMYAGQEFSINQTKDLYDFHVTLNKIIIGNQNFGKYEDGFASIITTGYVSQWIIGDFTFTAKHPANLSTLQLGIGWHINGGGTSYNSAVYQGKLSTGATKFGFFQDGLDVPMTGNESQNIKLIVSLLDQFSGNGPYTFQVADSKYLYQDTDNRKVIDFDLSQYLKY